MRARYRRASGRIGAQRRSRLLCVVQHLLQHTVVRSGQRTRALRGAHRIPLRAPDGGVSAAEVRAREPLPQPIERGGIAYRTAVRERRGRGDPSRIRRGRRVHADHRVPLRRRSGGPAEPLDGAAIETAIGIAVVADHHLRVLGNRDEQPVGRPVHIAVRLRDQCAERAIGGHGVHATPRRHGEATVGGPIHRFHRCIAAGGRTGGRCCAALHGPDDHTPARFVDHDQRNARAVE